ncbi:hypothetical protein BKI51_19605 [Alphaproteobacteria bacterium AO1-B]|nr:hypothetical protein BKI51_19605 [Alphaproteobacteria bacterium AO1-B]
MVVYFSGNHDFICPNQGGERKVSIRSPRSGRSICPFRNPRRVPLRSEPKGEWIPLIVAVSVLRSNKNHGRLS